jgi:hypothetical protein
MVRRVAGVLLTTLILAAATARAEDREERVFTIQVDNKAAGQGRMTILRRDDGSEVVTSQAEVSIRFLLKYTYRYQGTETWKEGRLLDLESTCNDNGKRFRVTAKAEEAGLRVTINGREHLGRADVWTTSYWKLLEARPISRPMAVLDVDRGEEQTRYLHYLGVEHLEVAGQRQRCDHFRLAGGPAPVDLWFDGRHRLVREDFMELGHHTVVQLASVRR